VQGRQSQSTLYQRPNYDIIFHESAPEKERVTAFAQPNPSGKSLARVARGNGLTYESQAFCHSQF